MKNTDEQTKDIDKSLLESRAAEVRPAYSNTSMTYADWETKHDPSYEALMDVLKGDPALSIQGIDICDRLVKAGYSIEDAARIASESVDVNEF